MSGHRVSLCTPWVVVLTGLPLVVAAVSFIGCATWAHEWGMALGGLLLGVTLLRVGMLLWARQYAAKHKGRLGHTGGILAAAPLPLCLLSGFRGRVRVVDDGPSAADGCGIDVYGTEERPLQMQEDASDTPLVVREGWLRRLAFWLRNACEVALFALVVVQLWARFDGGSKDVHWTSWEDVPACSTENCYYAAINVTTPDQTYRCTHDWLDTQPRIDIRHDGHSDSEFFIHAVQLMKIFPFPDDFAAALDSSNLLQVHSKSRLGKKDFGVNKNRVNNYLDYLRDNNCV